MSGFWTWWQTLPLRIDPYIVEIGSFKIGYYGLMYVVAFVSVYLLSLYRIKREEHPYKAVDIENALIWCAVGLLLGARLGYALIYYPGYYIVHPLEIFLPVGTEGGLHYTGISGMSYHGGAVGAIVAGIIFCRRRGFSFWDMIDFLIPSIAFSYTFGRLGNFINGELWGRATDVAWGMYFPADPERVMRHPSQLYEAFFEGIFLFSILWPLRNRRPFRGYLIGLYLIGYGVVRFFIEFFRQPDAHLGTVLGPFSMGQALSAAMIAAGGAVLIVKRSRNTPEGA